MTFDQFKKMMDFLLTEHYGIQLQDTRLDRPGFLLRSWQDKERPIEWINWSAEKDDLDRIDSNQPLTLQDECDALMHLGHHYGYGEDILTCPMCGSRTEMVELAKEAQHHTCLNSDCGYEFVASPDDDVSDDEEE